MQNPDHYDDNDLTFVTNYFLDDAFNSDHSYHFFNIFPYDKRWDFTLLACFLNQMPNFIKRLIKPFKTDIKKPEYHTKFTFIDVSDPLILIKEYVGQSITVIGSIQFIKLMFIPKKEFFFSNLRKWFKFRETMVFQEHLRYELHFQSINTATNAFGNIVDLKKKS